MKRKLLRQMGNEWKTNVWLSLELLIVSVVMWYITDYLYVHISIFCEPKGFDTEHCYLIQYASLTSKSPDYIPDRGDTESNEDLITLMDRLAQRPEIEAVAMGNNSYPYNGSNSTMKIKTDTFSGSGIRRYVTPDFPKVFRIHGVNGETPEQLSEFLKDTKKLLVSDNVLRKKYRIKSMSEFIGKEFSDNNMGDTVPVAASYIPMRYDDYTPEEWSKSMMRSIPSKYYNQFFNELVVRVRENMDKDFIENLMNDADRHFRIGNFYIAFVQSFDDIRHIHQRSDASQMRIYITGAAFLALNIFLGLLGTFWFRTSQRIPEIAIRKANGASAKDIFRRVIGEGELLLLIVTPIAVVFDWLLAHYELNTYYHGGYFELSRFVACVLIAWGFMAFMILLGILIPAKRAMKIAPAEALKSE
ncbi:MAG: ABC transporter permease [Bacteroides sp.]|nr:ABC transporter permease [Bacteroides sp.]